MTITNRLGLAAQAIAFVLLSQACGGMNEYSDLIDKGESEGDKASLVQVATACTAMSFCTSTKPNNQVQPALAAPDLDLKLVEDPLNTQHPFRIEVRPKAGSYTRLDIYRGKDAAPDPNTSVPYWPGLGNIFGLMKPDFDVEPGHTYYYQAKATDGVSSTPAWSGVFSKAIAGADPVSTLTAPIPISSFNGGPQITFQWTSSHTTCASSPNVSDIVFVINTRTGTMNQACGQSGPPSTFSCSYMIGNGSGSDYHLWWVVGHDSCENSQGSGQVGFFH